MRAFENRRSSDLTQDRALLLATTLSQLIREWHGEAVRIADVHGAEYDRYNGKASK